MDGGFFQETRKRGLAAPKIMAYSHRIELSFVLTQAVHFIVADLEVVVNVLNVVVVVEGFHHLQ